MRRVANRGARPLADPACRCGKGSMTRGLWKAEGCKERARPYAVWGVS